MFFTCSMTSGAIQHGVPTNVFLTLFLVTSPPVAKNALTPKSEKKKQTLFMFHVAHKSRSASHPSLLGPRVVMDRCRHTHGVSQTQARLTLLSATCPSLPCRTNALSEAMGQASPPNHRKLSKDSTQGHGFL